MKEFKVPSFSLHERVQSSCQNSTIAVRGKCFEVNDPNRLVMGAPFKVLQVFLRSFKDLSLAASTDLNIELEGKYLRWLRGSAEFLLNSYPKAVMTAYGRHTL
jgi:hypothetical protein